MTPCFILQDNDVYNYAIITNKINGNKLAYFPIRFGQVTSKSRIKFKIQTESYIIFTLRIFV